MRGRGEERKTAVRKSFQNENSNISIPREMVNTENVLPRNEYQESGYQYDQKMYAMHAENETVRTEWYGEMRHR